MHLDFFRNWDPLPDWRFEATLGEGGQGRTLLARAAEASTPPDLPDRAAVKCVPLQGAVDAEQLRREADILADLDHPRIPGFVEAREAVDPEGGRWHFLVQEYVDGKSLRQQIEAGDRMSTEETQLFLASMLETLAYLHEREPPLIHRDVKPANIIRHADGDYRLVDYGAAGEMSGNAGDNVIGTTGFIPPEQFFGSAVPASDLYGLGATTLHAVSHIHPADFPADGLELKIGRRVSLPTHLERLLNRLLAPEPQERFPSAHEALEFLRDDTPDLPAPTDETTNGGAVAVRRNDDSLTVTVDSKMGFPPKLRRILLGILGGTVGGAAVGGFSSTLLALAPVLALTAITYTFYQRHYTATLEVGPDGGTWRRTRLLGLAEEETSFDDPAGLDAFGDDPMRLTTYDGSVGPVGHDLLPSEREKIQRALRHLEHSDKNLSS